MGTVAALSIGMAVRAHRRGVCDQRSGKPTFSTGSRSRGARSFATKSDQGRTRPHVPETLRLGIQRAAAPVLLGCGFRDRASDGADRPRDVSLVCRGVSVCGHDVWKVVPVSGPAPQTEAYDKFKFGQFADWRIAVDGLVARPTVLSLADLLRMPPATQITHQQCEEGWSFIAEWTGVRLSTVLNQVGVSANAKYVYYFSIQDNWFDSLDMQEEWNP